MRKPFLTLFALAALASVLLYREARADDAYVGIDLKPGADAGTTAQTTAFPVGGPQGMIRCENFSVRLKMCDSTTVCNAGANDTLIDADKSTDICARTSQRSLGLYRLYDGGVPDCRLYTVNPKTVCPP